MAVGSKSKYTDKQKRQAKHIEDSEKKEGRSSKAAERIAYATVNKQDGGGKKGGGGSKKKKTAKKASKTVSKKKTKKKSTRKS